MADSQEIAGSQCPDTPPTADPSPELLRCTELEARLAAMDRRLEAANRYREQQCAEAVAAVLEKHQCLLRATKAGIEIKTR